MLLQLNYCEKAFNPSDLRRLSKSEKRTKRVSKVSGHCVLHCSHLGMEQVVKDELQVTVVEAAELADLDQVSSS